jgi:hypothetical protein
MFKKGNRINVGRTPWNKGTPMSEVTKQRQREAHKNQVPYNKGKHLVDLLGRKRAALARERNSEAHMDQTPWNKGKRGLQIAWNKGVPQSRTANRMQSKTMKQRYATNLIIWNKGTHGLMADQRGPKNPQYGKHHTLAWRRQHSKDIKEKFKDENYARSLFQKWNMRPNDTELYLDALIQLGCPGEWKYVGDGEVWIGGKNPDWINVNGQKALIEYNGFFKHTPARDAAKARHFSRYGFRTLNLYKVDLSDIPKLIEKIENFSKERMRS